MTAIAQRGPAKEHSLLVIERILRDREGIWRQIATEHEINGLIGQMLASSTGALLLYGVVLGASNGLLQAAASALKLPVLFILTLVICLPTLYLFNLVFGARLTVRQALATVLAAITVTAMLTLAFAPISIFFLISAPDYNFFKLLNVGIMTLTGFVGLSFLVDGMRHVNIVESAAAAPVSAQPPTTPADVAAVQPAWGAATPQREPVNMTLLYVWIVLYGFVGTQLAWTLRPFFGDPGLPFELFRQIEGNFYTNVVQTIGRIFS